MPPGVFRLSESFAAGLSYQNLLQGTKAGNTRNDGAVPCYGDVDLIYLHPLSAGDANRDFAFDQLDLVQVQQTGKYLSGQPATWGEGDWNRAPSGDSGSPPAGDGVFNQLDIVAVLNAGTYLAGPYTAIANNGWANYDQTSIVYCPRTGEVWVDAPVGKELTSINIDSVSGIFTVLCRHNTWAGALTTTWITTSSMQPSADALAVSALATWLKPA